MQERPLGSKCDSGDLATIFQSLKDISDWFFYFSPGQSVISIHVPISAQSIWAFCLLFPGFVRIPDCLILGYLQVMGQSGIPCSGTTWSSLVFLTEKLLLFPTLFTSSSLSCSFAVLLASSSSRLFWPGETGSPRKHPCLYTQHTDVL